MASEDYEGMKRRGEARGRGRNKGDQGAQSGSEQQGRFSDRLKAIAGLPSSTFVFITNR